MQRGVSCENSTTSTWSWSSRRMQWFLHSSSQGQERHSFGYAPCLQEQHHLAHHNKLALEIQDRVTSCSHGFCYLPVMQFSIILTPLSQQCLGHKARSEQCIPQTCCLGFERFVWYFLMFVLLNCRSAFPRASKTKGAAFSSDVWKGWKTKVFCMYITAGGHDAARLTIRRLKESAEVRLFFVFLEFGFATKIPF